MTARLPLHQLHVPIKQVVTVTQSIVLCMLMTCYVKVG